MTMPSRRHRRGVDVKEREVTCIGAHTQMGTVKARDEIIDVRKPEPARAWSTISEFCDAVQAVLSSRTTLITPRFLPRRTYVRAADSVGGASPK